MIQRLMLKNIKSGIKKWKDLRFIKSSLLTGWKMAENLDES